MFMDPESEDLQNKEKEEKIRKKFLFFYFKINIKLFKELFHYCNF